MNRPQPTNPEQETPESAYKWGLFYYNPADKRILVPKLSGLGWTFNFAKWWSYVFMLIIICSAIAVSVIASRQKK